ncbi:acyl-CoA dehydrogenase [Smaragdicoccus niigatensis]|uniref:acyl-CoA dehydrogenase n=1 Tax=Smaragdicoccus niigatensis TaxID=359359 RepID=UPI000368F6E8|nr:acyl-CoA dehydrogenase [Smaragdicoccus niigatensis]
MGHYKSNVRDLEFNLFEVLGIGGLLDAGVWGDLDAETVRDILAEVARLGEGPIAESFADADRNPTRFDPVNHEVIVPESMKKTLAAIKDSGWSRVGIPEALGGVQVPAALQWSVSEILCAANSSALYFNLAPLMSSVLYELGTQEQKVWAKEGIERGWAATMVLTEPDAGSDVGDGKTKAIPQADGTWHIEGVKRFISGGDVGDTAPNSFHLVLARPEGASAGTKGLSLFYVPKFLFDRQTFELTTRNGVFATGLEHKMGLRASPTCELTFGAHGVPAVGWLVGDVHDGIAQMFKVIENARMGVGTKAAGTLSTGYLNALEYAKLRIQSADLTEMMDKNAARVAIIRHPDVRRSLMTQKAHAEGLRALYMYAAAHQDPEVAALVSGADAEMAARVNDMLLPIVKGYGSEKAYELLTESLQTLGGSGYLCDYPIEQYIRDSKVDSLYEGTTAIQALDFFFRKLIRDGGVAFGHVVSQIRATVDGGRPELKVERELLSTALSDVEEMVSTLTLYTFGAAGDRTEVYRVGLGSVRFLHAVGDLIVGWRLLVGAQVALAAVDAGAIGKDVAFYQGKVAVAQFFARNVLPHLSAVRAIIESIDKDVMDLDDAAF